MGGEGVDWVSHAMFTKVPHVFQNLGDGTYYHSGYLAIRQAIAAKANITYKILFNDAVAMTGGQPVDGIISVDAHRAPGRGRGREAGGRAVATTSRKYDAITAPLSRPAPSSTTAPSSTRCSARLREMPGVTVLIYEQTCAAEKRRRRKKGELVDPARRLFINDARLRRLRRLLGAVATASPCCRSRPTLGRKRKIDQSSCNKDYSCAKGFCPSFVGVVGGRLRKRTGALAGAGGERFAALVAALPQPAAHALDRALRPAGHRRRRHRRGHGRRADRDGRAPRRQRARACSTSWASRRRAARCCRFVRLADVTRRAEPGAHRHAAGRRGAGLRPRRRAPRADALQTVRHGRTRVLANTHEIPVAESLRNPDASLQGRRAAGEARVRRRRRAGRDPGRAGAGRGLPRRHHRLQHRRAGLRLAARAGAGGPGGDAARDRAERRRGREQQAGVLARPARRGRPGGAAASCCTSPTPATPARRDARRAGRARRRASSPATRTPAYARALSPRWSARCAQREEAVGGRRGGLPLTRAVATQPAQADGLQGRVRGRAPLHRRRVPRSAARAVRGRRRRSSSTWRRRRCVEAEGRRPRRRAKVRFGPLDVAGAEGAGARQGAARHAVRSVRPHRGAPPRAAR